MSLTSLLRGIVALLVIWTMAGLSLGLLGKRVSVPERYRPVSAADQDAVLAGSSPRCEGSTVLVDRRTGAVEPIKLPEGERWSLLAACPWRDAEGRLLAAGRWARSAIDSNESAFLGLGVISLPQGEVVARLALDLLPTGRPCWLPDQPGALLFPAGDGKLYRTRSPLIGDQAETPSPRLGRRSLGQSAAEPLAWLVEPPFPDPIVVNDPVISTDPRLRRFVFAAVSVQGPAADSGPARRMYRPSKLWWLELSEDGRAIQAAGPLRAGACAADSEVGERHPNLAIDNHGIRLVFLERTLGDPAVRLRHATLVLDARTGKPRLENVADALTTPPSLLACAPLLVATDGRSVFGLDRRGKHARLLLGSL